MKTGLILEGGAMRGMFTAGVLDVFMENGIDFDGAVGTSAGATFGCNIKSRQIGRALRYNKRFCGDKRYGNFSTLLKTGDVFDTEFCYHDIPFVYDIWDQKTFAENPMEFYTVSTDVETGKALYYKCGKGGESDIKWIQASASMPLFANIVEIGGRKLLDGGIADSIAIRFMQKIGYNKNVIILTQPHGFVKKPNLMMPAFKKQYRDYPAFIAACASRHIRYNATLRYIEEQEALGNVYVIRPPHKLDVSKLEKNPDKLQAVYDIGRTVALSSLDSIKALGFCK